MNYVTEIDVADRLLRRKPNWFHGKPRVGLAGIDGNFGKLQFYFSDEVVEFGVYIKDREKIIDAAEMAVENFSEIVNRIWWET